MISKDIVCSDAFISLSVEAQILYFHLMFNADNRGYINNTRLVMASLGTINKTHLDELVSSKFVLDRGNGLYLIKHWYIHNDIPKYLSEETNYLVDLESLYFDENYSYTKNATENPVKNVLGKKKPIKENKRKTKTKSKTKIKDNYIINNTTNDICCYTDTNDDDPF